MKKIYLAILAFLRERFSLSQDQDNESEIVEAIRKGVVFKGINLWMLIFAIFIASIGLNVNSTAVIIGAMLISPLMGPIMGLGLGAGINDLPLINVAIKNLAIAVIFSIITSALYFSISPLSQAQSELLARTSPTFWDVLIAFFGGLAGVFAGSSKEKGNAIPGVAIATALMPPLCTAGYGLATGNLSFFFGALYLFFINSVMISASTFMVVQFLNFRHAEYMDQGRAKNVKRIIYALVFFTVVPSIYFGYTIVRKSGFEIEANNYIRKEFSNESYYVLNKQIEYKNSKDNKITLYVGGYMDSLQIEKKKANLENYRLENCVLEIKQGTQLKEILKNEQNQMDQISLAHAKELADKDSIIGNLKLELESNSKKFYNPEAIGEELRIFFPSISEFGISEGTIYSEKDSSSSASTLVFLASEGKIKESQYEEIERWLEKRLDTKNIKIVKE
ncbi:MAG: TIGR00341 family protein [Chitinophagales bacterium]|nr:TIGR00341 family protein [Bacteroidota bacterium]MCB9257196.1 TIGR00341 family protein [Chitinophagales bacterium]